MKHAEHKINHKQLSSEAMGCLLAHAWPGNVRELRNIVQRLVVTSQGRTVHRAPSCASIRDRERSAESL